MRGLVIEPVPGALHRRTRGHHQSAFRSGLVGNRFIEPCHDDRADAVTLSIAQRCAAGGPQRHGRLVAGYEGGKRRRLLNRGARGTDGRRCDGIGAPVPQRGDRFPDRRIGCQHAIDSSALVVDHDHLGHGARCRRHGDRRQRVDLLSPRWRSQDKRDRHGGRPGRRLRGAATVTGTTEPAALREDDDPAADQRHRQQHRGHRPRPGFPADAQHRPLSSTFGPRLRTTMP